MSLGRILKFQNLTCSLHLVLRKFKRNQICVSIINLQKMFCTSHAYGNTQDYTHYIVFMSTILCGTTKGSGYVRIAVKATLQMPKAVYTRINCFVKCFFGNFRILRKDIHFE